MLQCCGVARGVRGLFRIDDMSTPIRPNVHTFDEVRKALVGLEQARADLEARLALAEGGAAAGDAASYVLVTAEPLLANSRTLAVSGGVSMADGGGGGTLTLSAPKGEFHLVFFAQATGVTIT